MHSRSKLLPSLSIALLLAGIISQAASCTLDQNGTLPPEEVQACQTADTCPDDKNQCTLNTCSDNKVCEYKPIEGIAPEQTAGDCQQGFCSNDGVYSEQPDDMDIPDDNQSCTNDGCMNGIPSHVARMDGESCTIGDAAGSCKAGKCTVQCDAQKPCNDMNPCTQDTCNASTGTCTFSNLDGLPTPGAMEMVGDCKQQICVNGVDTSFDDNADVPPDDGNTCTKDSCVGGMLVHKEDPLGTICIASPIMGFCDANGACVQCNVPENCPEIVPTNFCKRRTCISNMCGEENLPVSDLPVAKDGDCKKPVCDGNGMVVMANDNTDIPIDGNDCTVDVCTNGVPSNPPEPNTAKCGPTMMQTCDGMGKCGCANDTECGKNDDCKAFSCVMSKCVISYAANGTPLPKGQQTDGDCQVLQCDGAGNTIGVLDPIDAPDDKNDCTQNRCDSMGNPIYPPEPINSVCADKANTVCDGLGKCVKAPGVTCADGTECVTGFCTDGVCCTDACSAGCMACNLTNSAGTCSNLPTGTDDGMFCSGTNSCDGMGACKRDNGQACGMNTQCASGHCVEGVCCNTDCMETCKTCTRSGFVGTCIELPNDQPDTVATMTCVGDSRCDGLGNCKKRNGYACTMAAQCLSSYCVDGFCCGASCDQLCVACSAALNGVANGSCQPIPNGADPQNECPGSNTCNGMGGCK